MPEMVLEGRAMAKRTMLYPLGVTITESGAEILVQAEAEKLELVLFKAGAEEEAERIAFDPAEKIGDVWMLSLDGYDFQGMEYGFEADGQWMADASAKAFAGRKVWGAYEKDAKVKARMPFAGFAWDDDEHPETPYSETVIYRLHVRGFTKHETSYVKNKGTYAGVVQMIPYIKDLGATAVELMPVTDFDEVMMDEVPSTVPGGKKEKQPNGRLNFWGYGPSYLYAPKASYGTGVMPAELEFKIMVKELHRSGLECILELYFTGDEAPGEVLNVLRYWVEEYHVDGFKLAGNVPLEMAAEDPFLRTTKLFAGNWQDVLKKRAEKKEKVPGGSTAGVSVREKNLAEYNEDFMKDMRSVLRGDQDIVEKLKYWLSRNPEGFAVINYMANTNGFTMMDMVSFNEKHNEDNGEENRDGTDDNRSWNCGVEGNTDDARVLTLRKQQIYNAFMLLLLSQGTPLIMAGDEFGNSQGGNNNAYCQDNETGWVDWRLLEANIDLHQAVKELIAFRKAHKAFHKDHAAKFTDYKSFGCPDVSFHGQSAWKLENDSFRKQLGVMYWGAYEKKADGTPDDTFYIAYNMHWGTHHLGLPRLPYGHVWKAVYDTSGGSAVVKNRLHAQIPPYSVVIFMAAEETGYAVYETPIGEITLLCKKGELTDLGFGKMVPQDQTLPEEHWEVLDRAYEQLMEYFEGDRKEFDLPLHTEGTEFQEKVWAALCTIPYGETRTYKQIAAQIGNENASRAVGMANNRNPLAIFIPCHRVIGADGGITGYAGGEEIKKRLLEIEETFK